MSRPITRFVREQRREDTERRQAEYDNLTLDEKIARAESRPGESRRELSRLRALKDAA